MQKLSLFLLLIFIISCAASGPVYTGKEIVSKKDSSVVYLFRPFSAPYWRSPEVKINGVFIADLLNEGFIVISLVPGKYNISLDWAWDTYVPDRNIVINFSSGKKYYLRINHYADIDKENPDTGFAPGTIKAVSKKEALKIMRVLRRVTKVESTNKIRPL